ncbi:response regulator [Dyadobacter frigoris]|nr:response regulator [Dyadobacter frigoris]
MIDKLLADCCLTQFVDGQQAIDFICSNHDDPGNLPQLIFLDINMPNLNGWQFLDRLENSNIANYHPLIYMASSSSDRDDILRAEAYTQIKGYLVKPIMPQILEDIISDFTKSENSIR